MFFSAVKICKHLKCISAEYFKSPDQIICQVRAEISGKTVSTFWRFGSFCLPEFGNFMPHARTAWSVKSSSRIFVTQNANKERNILPITRSCDWKLMTHPPAKYLRRRTKKEKTRDFSLACVRPKIATKNETSTLKIPSPAKKRKKKNVLRGLFFKKSRPSTQWPWRCQ